MQTILADAHRLSIDSDGRIVLPQELINYADLKTAASVVGLGKSFQVWKPANFGAHRENNRARAREQGATLRIVAKNSGGIG